MAEILLGLDVGSRYIKTALIKRDKNRQVIDAGVIKTPDGSVVDGAIIYMDSIADEISAYIARSGVKPDGLAVSINSPDIITRNLRLPALPEAEIPPAVKFEILRLFPSIKDTHEITQRVISSSESSVSVLAALCPIELIKAYQDLSERLNLPLRYADVRADAQAKAVDFYFVGSEGGSGGGSGNGGSGGGGSGSGGGGSSSSGDAGNSNEANSSGEAGLLIDIGYRNSLVSVISRGKLVLSRYIMCGAAAYDNMVAEKAGIDREDVERARLSGDFSNTSNLADIALDSYESENILSICFMEVIDQIKQTAEHYMDDISSEKISYITVAGEGGMIPGIEDNFARSYNLKPRILTPHGSKITVSRALMKNGNPKLLLAAVGAAMTSAGAASATREMNFAPDITGGTGKRRGLLSRRLTVALSAALLLAIVSISIGMYFIADQRRNNLEIARINAVISSDVQTAEHNEAIGGAQVRLSTLTAILNTIDTQSMKASMLLDELASLAPDNLFVVNFNMVDTNNAVMSGRAKNYESISDFAHLLRQTEKYDSVRINSITANQSVSDAYTDYGFSITIITKAGY